MTEIDALPHRHLLVILIATQCAERDLDDHRHGKRKRVERHDIARATANESGSNATI